MELKRSLTDHGYELKLDAHCGGSMLQWSRRNKNKLNRH